MTNRFDKPFSCPRRTINGKIALGNPMLFDVSLRPETTKSLRRKTEEIGFVTQKGKTDVTQISG